MKITLSKSEIQTIIIEHLKANGLRMSGDIIFDSYNRIICDVTWLEPKKVEKSDNSVKNDGLEGIKKGLSLDVS